MFNTKAATGASHVSSSVLATVIDSMPLDYRTNLRGCWETIAIMHKKMSPAAGPCFVVLKQVGEIQKTTANPEDPAMNWILQDPETCGSMEICGFMKIKSTMAPPTSQGRSSL